MINLRKEAKGRQCTVAIPGVCNGNPETTVLAHLNNKPLFRCGMSQKVPDWAACFACSDCHDLLDGRTKSEYYTDDEIKIMHYDAIMRTQMILRKEGKL